MNNHPIGILDSGVGGLTVLRAIAQELPQESFVYIGDSQNTPYGEKSEEAVYELAKNLVEFLIAKKVKAIVIACNTITVSCLDRLRIDYPEMPLIGTVPVVKSAAALSKKKHIGILSTTRTAQSDYQKHLIEEFADGCVVLNYGTDKLVPLIEQGKLGGEKLQGVLRQVLAPFLKENIDTLALGCTHFPLVRNEIQQLLGPEVQLLDSGEAIARQLRRVLERNTNLATEKSGEIAIYTTGNMQIAKNLAISTIEKQPLTVRHILLNNDY